MSENSNNKPLNDRYQLDNQLGKGGMAAVYRARDLMLERDVAIKVLREDYSADPAFRERFRQEAKAAANLSHTNIVTVHDFGFDDEQLYIVMEYVPGKDLNTIIKERGRIDIGEAVDLAVQACAGIGYAHRAGLVHCDVKPHNFIVTPDKRLKVTDFGIARALASINPNEESDVVWGSPQYFSPEQAAGAAPSPASDVYSIGVILYYMLTGQLPFIGKTSGELARLHRFGEPIPPSELNPFITAPLEEIVLKVLSKEPSARYRTADQLGRVLRKFADQEMPALSAANVPAADTPSPSAETIRKPDSPATLVPANLRPQNQPEERPDLAEQLDIDWIAVGLALVALLAVGGLIPFWIWVYFVFNPPFS